MQDHTFRSSGKTSGCWVPQRLALVVSILLLGLPAAASDVAIERGTGFLALKSDLLADLGIRLEGPLGVPDETERSLLSYAAQVVGPLTIRLVKGSFEGFGAGALANGAGPRLVTARGGVDLAGYRVHTGGDDRSLSIRSDSGEPLFRVDHIHVHYDAPGASLSLRYADLRIAPELAARLGDARLAGRTVGTFELSAELARAPAALGVGTDGGGCSNPNFSLPIDVALTGISTVEQSALGGGQVALTPDAMLQNVGQGDVRWEPTLDPDHPLLAWALYRRTGDVFEQIGLSVTKHTFFAVNDDCPCPGGEILWAQGCTDVYGIFSNEDRSNLAPRSEITAFTAGWDPCGSIFDPECDEIHNFPPPADAFERRMTVPESELQVAGAQYYIENWYIVANDINIFNSMGWREIDPQFSGGFWTFDTLTPFANGSALDAWVANGTLDTTQSAQRVDTGAGHLELASRVVDVGGGEHRYEYAIMNFDFDQRLSALSIPIAAGVAVSATAFSDATATLDDDWSASIGATEVSFTAPNGAALDWGRMVRLSITAGGVSSVATLTLTPESGPPASIGVDAPAPVPEPAAALQLVCGVIALLLSRTRTRGDHALLGVSPQDLRDPSSRSRSH